MIFSLFSTKKNLLLLLWICLMEEGLKAAEKGRFAIKVTNDDLNCQYVSFSGKFSGDGNRVSVFASIRYGKKSSGVHELAFIWIEDVTTSRFKACLVKSGKRLRGKSALIDWFAFQGSQPGVFHGQTRFNLFTTGSRCNWVNFPQAFSSVPKIHVTVQHGIPNKDQDSMNVWIANVSTNRFEVCLQESTTFSGLHDKLSVNWMAYEHYPSVWEVKESSVVKFSENDVPSERDSYALCKNVSFSSPFYTAPVVLNTVINGDSGNANSGCPAKGPLITWLEEVTTSYFRVCIKDSAGYNGQRSKVLVDYLVIGDLDPCTNTSCKYHSRCVALSPNQFTCACESSCPPYDEQVCASNGRTFTSLCLLKQEICRTRGNYTKYHPGSCTGFNLQKGRHQFRNVPSWAEDHCAVIKFKPFIFYPDQKIYIQLTVNHVNYSDPTVVHEATTPWVEGVNSTQFTACVTRAGRNDYPSDSFATIDWVAYQGAPSGGVAGEKWFSRWWTGTNCQTVAFAKGKYFKPPTIFVTAEHHRSHLMHDATSIWLEDVTTTSFKICLRELRNFAGVHDDISVNWLAFESLHRPFFSEHSEVTFQNNLLPSADDNFAFCKDLRFMWNYKKTPTVLLTAKHSTKGGNTVAQCNGIASWIEFITRYSFRICVKELFIQQFDPLTVSYAVLSDVCEEDWAYFNGYCYRKVSSCDSWTNSQAICSTLGAYLPSIHSQEENVYVQSLHGGERSWLGLSDASSKGNFSWSDGTLFDFYFWAEHQPKNLHKSDCVHTLGFLRDHQYKWKDVNCTECHRFTCKKDYNECDDFSYHCPVNTTCVNKNGSYSCRCLDGSLLNGKTCGAKNCAELYKSGQRVSGVYRIDPDSSGAFDVYCDQTTAGGGWTVFQKRMDGSVDFYRGWTDYKNGFGNLNGEFWLGLDKIHRLTRKKNKLRVDLMDTTGGTAYAEYHTFAVAGENTKYQLSLGEYSGTAGDSLSSHRGRPFTTKDQDNDGEDCAVKYKGAWWYFGCHYSNLNGLYHYGKHSSQYANGVNWYHWKGYLYSAKRAEMKIRPVQF